MKISKKKLIVAFIIFMLCILFISQIVQATTFDPDHYKPSSTNSVSGATKLEDLGNRIIGVVQVIGSLSSVVG